MARPVAPVGVQLVQTMELRLFALVAQPKKIPPGRMAGWRLADDVPQGGVPGSAAATVDGAPVGPMVGVGPVVGVVGVVVDGVVVVVDLCRWAVLVPDGLDPQAERARATATVRAKVKQAAGAASLGVMECAGRRATVPSLT